MNYLPLNDFVIVRKLAADSVSAGGIALLTAQENDRAVVVATNYVSSNFGFAVQPHITVGDIVLLRWKDAIQVEGETYAVDEKDIICKLQETKASLN